ncbi:MAG: hypothetical protein WDN04_21940 [Rhodospirillales bacterium]
MRSRHFTTRAGNVAGRRGKKFPRALCGFFTLPAAIFMQPFETSAYLPVTVFSSVVRVPTAPERNVLVKSLGSGSPIWLAAIVLMIWFAMPVPALAESCDPYKNSTVSTKFWARVSGNA